MLDWSIVATAAAAGILSWCYLEPSSLRQAALLVFGLTALGYLILAVGSMNTRWTNCLKTYRWRWWNTACRQRNWSARTAGIP